jgi:hypothetical protein
MTPGTQFTTLYFLCNSRMNPNKLECNITIGWIGLPGTNTLAYLVPSQVKNEMKCQSVSLSICLSVCRLRTLFKILNAIIYQCLSKLLGLDRQRDELTDRQTDSKDDSAFTFKPLHFLFSL